MCLSETKGAHSYTGAFHAFKLLAGGVRGEAQRRGLADRGVCHRCHGCGSGEVVAVWTSPHGGSQGEQWCAACRPVDGDGIHAQLALTGGGSVAEAAAQAKATGKVSSSAAAAEAAVRASLGEAALGIDDLGI